MILLPRRRPGSSWDIQNTSGSRGELCATTAADCFGSEEVGGMCCRIKSSEAG
jgi:hypothetical protein